MNWRRELIERYPMLKGGGYPSVGGGWRRILERLCEEIDRIAKAEGLEVRVVQINEKFGSLRFYIFVDHSRIRHLIDAAEKASEVTCEACGAPGTVRMPKNLSGWYKACCVRHHLFWPDSD